MSPTARTAGDLGDEDYPWHGDYHDADLPHVVTAVRGKLFAFPHSDFTDDRVLRSFNDLGFARHDEPARRVMTAPA